MADNVAITAGAGTPIATDDAGGNHYQRIKLVDSAADQTTPYVSASTSPVGTEHAPVTRPIPYIRTDATTVGFNATTSTAAAQEARAANASRRGLLVQNFSDAHCLMMFNVAPTLTVGAEVGIVIPAMGQQSFTSLVDTRSVNVIRLTAGTSRLLVTEW